MKFTNIISGSELDIAANELLEAAHKYWVAFNTHAAPKAVVWLQDASDQLVVMTRGEYSEQLQEFINDF
jgi:hypothetical protein